MLATFTVNVDYDTDSWVDTDAVVSLREAIERANVFSPGADTITFAPSLNGETITLGIDEFGNNLNLGAAAELFISEAVEILGPGRDELTIDAGLGTNMIGGNGDGFKVFDIALAATSSEVVKISGLTITGGDVTGDGGGIRSSSSLELQSMAILDNHSSGDGGGIHVNIAVPGQRQFTMNDVMVGVHS